MPRSAVILCEGTRERALSSLETVHAPKPGTQARMPRRIRYLGHGQGVEVAIDREVERTRGIGHQVVTRAEAFLEPSQRRMQSLPDWLRIATNRFEGPVDALPGPQNLADVPQVIWIGGGLRTNLLQIVHGLRPADSLSPVTQERNVVLARSFKSRHLS